MRRFLLALTAVLAATSVFSSLVATAGARPADAPVVKIHRLTSAIYWVDPSYDGNAPISDWWRVVNVTASIEHCTPGTFSYEHVTLVQDGISYPWASQALGAGEVSCTSGAGMSFYGSTLHVGHAVATIELLDGDVVVARDRRVVTIPADTTTGG